MKPKSQTGAVARSPLKRHAQARNSLVAFMTQMPTGVVETVAVFPAVSPYPEVGLQSHFLHPSAFLDFLRKAGKVRNNSTVTYSQVGLPVPSVISTSLKTTSGFGWRITPLSRASK